jgi:GntR family transcriptional regulator, transcriptional repressor for pyruvate dehydrogenase complex
MSSARGGIPTGSAPAGRRARAREEPHGDPGLEPTIGTPLQRVRKAYEQVYDQLRELIMRGELARGQRLPGEAALAGEFGVSRGTVREALRLLAAQNLIRTAKGAGGGSFVTLPTADHVSEVLQANIRLLSESREVSAEDMLEARELLEAFAARLAARRRGEADLERLRACIIDDPLDLGTERQHAQNTGFHTALLEASGNTLLAIAAQPVFGILQTNMRRREIEHGTLARVNEDHRGILAAVEKGDANAAEQQMREHLAMLRETYVRLWTRHGERQLAGADSGVGD